MRRVEQLKDITESLRVIQDELLLDLWTKLPCIVESFDKTTMTIEAQPCIKVKVKGTFTQLPLLLDVPILPYSGGKISFTLPINKGDECLVFFATRCIDAWWENGGVQDEAEWRLHDLSDGFAYFGPRSKPNVLQNYSGTTAQIRSDDGLLVIDLDPTTHAVSITASSITLNGPVTINGNVATSGTLTNNGHSVGSTHKHTGVQTGSGTTGNPQ